MHKGRATAAALLTVLVLGGGAWLAWERLAAPATDGDAGAAASADLAEATLDRFERFQAGQAGDRLALSGPEVSSVVRYAMPGLLPPGVADAEVALQAGHLTLSGRVATAAFPELPSLDGVIAMLPDTVPVRLDGELTSFGKESVAFRVRGIEAAAIPLPERMIPRLLSAIGRRERGGLPGNALQLPLPSGVGSVSVENDSLILAATKR